MAKSMAKSIPFVPKAKSGMNYTNNHLVASEDHRAAIKADIPSNVPAIRMDTEDAFHNIAENKEVNLLIFVILIYKPVTGSVQTQSWRTQTANTWWPPSKCGQNFGSWC